MQISVRKTKLTKYPLVKFHHQLPGLRTSAGHPVLTFPDSRCAGIGFEDYQLQLDYLMQTQREEEELPSCSSSSSSSASDSNVQQSRRQQQQQNRWIVVVDRRQDRWSSVRMVLAFLLVRSGSFF
jgi:hypothetical protein